MASSVSLLPLDSPAAPAGEFDADRTLPTSPALTELLFGRGLGRGASYSVEGASSLALALLAGPSAAGSWCGVVGVRALGVEAAAEFGVDLSRLVLIPSPGREWLRVVAALLDAFDIVLVRPPTRVSDVDARRLAARLRDRNATLVALGPWPGSELRLTVTDPMWTGLGDGHGHLRGRQATVTVSGRGSAARPRSLRLWLPGPDGGVHLVDSGPTESHRPHGPLRQVRAARPTSGVRPIAAVRAG